MSAGCSSVLFIAPQRAEASGTRTGSVTNTTSSANSGSTRHHQCPPDAQIMVVFVAGFGFGGTHISRYDYHCGNQLNIAVTGDYGSAFHQGSSTITTFVRLTARKPCVGWSGATLTAGANITYAFSKGAIQIPRFAQVASPPVTPPCRDRPMIESSRS